MGERDVAAGGEIRRAEVGDLDAVADIYAAARAFMRANGNPTQWAGAYPSRDDAARDLAADRLWVLDEGAGPVGVMAVMPGPDPTYARIEGPGWLDDGPYWVMHRMAVAAQGHGRGARMLAWLVARHDNVRADTHADNLPMQRALERAGFARRGTIWIADGSPRVAYHFVRR
ncbi:N-acetyltransferase family protein [Thermophilibacter sp.]